MSPPADLPELEAAGAAVVGAPAGLGGMASDHRNATMAPAELRRMFFRVFPSIAVPMFLAAIDATIVSAALTDMAASLGDVERISWVVISYLIASTIAAPVYGKLGDVLGRKRLMMAALVMFILASTACAFAPTMLWLTVARVVQGLGGGGLMTLSQALVGEAVPPRQRGQFQGYMVAVFMCASTFGPVAGGWLTAGFGWRSVFLVNLPLGAIAIYMVGRLDARPVYQARFSFDSWGLVFFTAFVVPLLLALERAQKLDASAIPVIAGLVVVSAASLVLLLRQELRSPSPLIPVRLLSQPAIWRCNAMAVCIGGTLVSNVTFMPIYLQVVRGVQPGWVGVLLLPLTAGVALGSLTTGRLITRTGRTALFPSIGLACATVVLTVLALVAPSLSFTELPVLLAVLSFTLGTGMPVVQITVQTLAGQKNLGASSASVQFCRSIGAALGTALVGAVLFAMLSFENPHTAELFGAVVEMGPRVLLSLGVEEHASMTAEISSAFRGAFLTVAAMCGAATVLAWTLPVRRL